MTYDQVRSATSICYNEKKSKLCRKPLTALTQTLMNPRTMNSPWRYSPHCRPHSVPHTFGERLSVQEHHRVSSLPPRTYASTIDPPHFNTRFDHGSHSWNYNNEESVQTGSYAKVDYERDCKRTKSHHDSNPILPSNVANYNNAYQKTSSVDRRGYRRDNKDYQTQLSRTPPLPINGGEASTIQSGINSKRDTVHIYKNEFCAYDKGAIVVSEPSNDDSSLSSFSNDHPRLLALPEDSLHLTALHCFLRRHCVYIFCAKADEIDVPRKGRKKPLILGQVGIGCIHCKDSSSKLKGCSYFPGSISGIYNATMIIQQRHFPVCPCVTKEVYGEYNKLKNLTARSASTKEYWISSAKELGMVDTKNGVLFRSKHTECEDSTTIPPPTNRTSAVDGDNSDEKPCLQSLVDPADRLFSTEYAYFVMEQMTPCKFTEADRLGKRKGHHVGFPGLACKYCYGGNGTGRFFPLTLKTFSDVSKSLHVLRNHLLKCSKAPSGLASKVSRLYNQHKDEKESTPFGSQKIFFDHVWRRLHPELNIPASKSNMKQGIQSAGINGMKGASTTMFLFQTDSPVQDLAQDTDIYRNSNTISLPASSDTMIPSLNNKHRKRYNFLDISDGNASSSLAPLPPLPAVNTKASKLLQESDSTSLNHSYHKPTKDSCMIPKKRYLYYHGISSRSSLKVSDGTSETLNPFHTEQEQKQGISTNYTDSDVSVAIILATGMGRCSKV